MAPVEPDKRVVMARVLKPGEADDGAFDLAFWQQVGAEGRFEAAWDMVCQASAIRGEDERQPRLQRSVLRVIRP
jgi:hypothetical protein